MTAENLLTIQPTPEEKITWMDWKPIMGENAWALLIGPLRLERLKAAKQGQKYVPFSTAAVQNAINSLTAFASMQSRIGVLYYACHGTLGNQGDRLWIPYEVSVENNTSVLTGLSRF